MEYEIEVGEVIRLALAKPSTSPVALAVAISTHKPKVVDQRDVGSRPSLVGLRQLSLWLRTHRRRGVHCRS